MYLMPDGQLAHLDALTRVDGTVIIGTRDLERLTEATRTLRSLITLHRTANTPPVPSETSLEYCSRVDSARAALKALLDRMAKEEVETST